MKAIAARIKNADKIELGGWLLVMFFLLCNAFMIIRGARNLIHSDGATAIMFAREQWMQGKLHPDGWWYGTDIWNIGLNTLILPFFALCKRWVDARAGAVILQTILMMFVMLWFKRIKILNNRVWFVILLMMLPVSEVNLNKLIQAVLRLYGAADQTASLLSLSGILKVFCFAYMVIMLFFIPILLMKNYHRLKSQLQRNFLIFSVLSAMAVVYLFVFTGMEQSRYLLWIYFYSLILFGIFMDNFQEIKAEFKKEIKAIFIAFFAMMFVVIYFYYITYDYQENPDVLGVNNETVFYKADYDLVEYMEKNNATFGYAPYWTAYSNHVISDGKVKMTALELDFSGPYLWLTSEKWYKPDSHQGECFVLVGDDMIENIPPIYDAKAIRKDQYKQYTIYVFDSVATLNDIWSTFAPAANEVISAK